MPILKTLTETKEEIVYRYINRENFKTNVQSVRNSERYTKQETPVLFIHIDPIRGKYYQCIKLYLIDIIQYQCFLTEASAPMGITPRA